MIILRQVYYSQKHDKNWHKGKETDSQKKIIYGGAGLAGFGSGLGIIDGLNTGDKYIIKARKAIALAKLPDESLEREIAYKKAELKDPDLEPEVRKAYNKFLEGADKRLEHNKAATERFTKRARKIANRKMAMSVGKRAAIGLGIGGGLAYLANKVYQ